MLGWPLKLKQTRKIVIKRVFFLVTFFLFALLILPHVVHAQDQATKDALGLTQVESEIMLGSEDIRLTIAKIIRVLLGMLGIIALSLMLYAGYTIMTSGGDSDKVLTGKKILINAAIGLLIILSSFAIVQFFIMKLAQATSFLGQGGGAMQGQQTFLGSGSLGRIVKDHYPFRDQRDVPRNTRISVTFNEAFDPASVFEDKNNGVANGTFGDCINTDSSTFDWDRDCDHLKAGAIQVYKLDADGKNTGSPLDMVALASDEGGKFFTVVMRPLQPLGDDRDPIGYSVDLTNNIKKASAPTVGMFESARDKHYKWLFYTGTEFDLSPPVVASVFPFPGETEARNTIIQINFNEPVDPTVAQGTAGTFYHIILQNMEPGANPTAENSITGSWRISNGYTTVEFVSDQACGENSCGETMYCLPFCTVFGCPEPEDSQKHNALIRTAKLVSLSSWEAVPFSGMTDMAGNALDGNSDGIQNDKPAPIGDAGNIGKIGNDDRKADNHLWEFYIENKIDRSAPYIKQIVPAIDAEEVAGGAENSVLFSKPMWSATFGGVEITEKIPIAVDDLWFRPRGQLIVDPVTEDKTYLLNISHRVFGPNGEDAYYFTNVSSTVKALNQNCIYPGRGPYGPTQGSVLECECTEDENGFLTCGTGCIGVTGVATTDTGCVYTPNTSRTDTALLKEDLSECLGTMNTISVF